jgi:hypothetical protein
MQLTKAVNLDQLEAEMRASSVPINALGTSGALATDDYELFTFGTDGHAVDVPPEATPVVAAHVPAPRVVEFSDDAPLEALARTTDATATQIIRVTLDAQSGYTGQVNVIGVDGGNGAVRVIRASFAIKRLNAGALAVGAPVVLASHGDAAAASWTVSMSVVGNDAIVSVTGAAGRTIDWLCRGQMMRFAPGGLGS